MSTSAQPAPDRQWLDRETHRLLDFTELSLHPAGGFAWLDEHGRPELERPVENWITTRVTHVMSLGHLLGRAGGERFVDHGIHALRTVLSDPADGGWYAAADAPGNGEKRAYEHAFIVLAASSATLAARPGASELLRDALDVMLTRFWDERQGAVVDVWNRAWTSREPYGGANANMHTVEAFLAAADVTGDASWRSRAARIADFFINDRARAHDWRIPEHYDADWHEVLDYNDADRAHRFRPYGVTVGHGFEWSRLCLHLSASLGSETPGWLLEAARGLFDRAVADGWHEDGFVYTTDWEGRPVVRDRLHWVICEAIAAAAALHRATGDTPYHDCYERWWAIATQHFVDLENGSWHAQLDEGNRPASTVWSGKPDTCHAIQATLLPRLPLAPSLASGIASGLLDKTV